MGSMLKRVVAMLLVICMVFPMMATGASATETDSTEAVTTPQTVETTPTVEPVGTTPATEGTVPAGTESGETGLFGGLTITGIGLEPYHMYEGIGGETRYETDQQTGQEVSYFHYNWQYENIPWILYLSDGSSQTLRELILDSFEDNGSWYHMEIEDDQSYAQPWTVGGSYPITIRLFNDTTGESFEASSTLEIRESPLVRFYVNPISFTYGETEETTTEENGEKVSWQRYNWENKIQYVAEFADGTILEGQDNRFYYDSRWYWFDTSDSQAPDALWQPGSHTGTVSVMGVSCDVQIDVQEHWLQSIQINGPVSIEENTGGRLWYEGTEEEFYFYEWQNYLNFTVYFTDGTSYTGTGIYYRYNGNDYYLEYDITQNTQNPWVVGGTYYVTVRSFSQEAQVQVNITESPLVDISIAPVSIVEGTCGGTNSDWNPDTGNYDLEYYRYWWWEQISYTATFTDGTVTGTGTGFEYQGRWYSIEYSDSQSYDKPWTAGNTYTVTAFLAGKKVDVDVTITESPLQSITLTPVTILENTNGSTYEDWMEDTQEYKQYYYYHWYWEVYATLTFTDTTITIPVGDGFEYQGQWYNLSYFGEQNYVNRWLPGNSYPVSVSFMGVTAQTQVTIEKLPIQSISFGTVSMKEYENGYWSSQWTENGEVQYFHYYWMNCIPYTVTFTDGTSTSGTGHDFYYNDEWIDFQYTDPQSVQNPFLAGGTYVVPVTLGDFTQDVYVSVYTSSQENGWEYMVQDGNAFITQCYNYDSVLTVPDTLGGYPVVGILDMSYVEYSVNELIIPDSVTMLSTDLFEGWGWRSNLRKVTLGVGITDLSMDLFDGCGALEAVDVSKGNSTYCSVDGVVYDLAMTTIVVFPLGKTGSYTIPDTVINADVIFNNLDSIQVSLEFNQVNGYVKDEGIIYNEDKTVIYSCDPNKTGSYVMPDSVTQIGRCAFANSQLSQVTVSPNVTEIVYYAFYNAQQLETVTIPDSVTCIGQSAFDGCVNLVEAQLPSNLQTLEYKAFAESGVESVTIPASLQDFGTEAFYSADVSDLTISEGVRYLGYSAFANTNVQSVVLPDSLTEMGGNVFSNCRQLTSLTIGSGLQTITWGSFSNTALTSVVFPENIEYIGGSAFSGCTQLRSVTFENDAIGFGENAFMNCPIESLELGQNVTYIGDRVFYGSALKEVTIPDSVTSITYRSFANSTQLMDIDIPEGLTELWSNSFENTAWYNSQPDGPVFLEHYYYGYKGEMPRGTIINIPENVTRFAMGAQRKGSTMVFTGDMPQADFYDMTVVYPAGNDTWTETVQDAQLAIDQKITWVAASHSGTCGDNLGWAIGPDGTLQIFGFGRMFDYIYGGKLVRSASSAAPWYEYADSISRVVIGENVEYIGTYAFADCAADTVVFAGEAPEIGENAFYNMTATATYPTGYTGWNSVASGGYGGSITWDALDTVVSSGTCGEGLTWTLDECGTLTVSGTGYMENFSWDSMPWYDCRDSIVRVVIEEGVTSIGSYAFYECNNLEGLCLPASLRSINFNAFYFCQALTELNLPEGLESIESWAFGYCSSLTEVVIPDSVTQIYDGAFACCSNLKTVHLGSGLTFMSYNAFSWCENLETVTVAEGATTLGKETFYYNRKLSQVNLPQSVTYISYGVFRGCSELKQIQIPESVTEISYSAFRQTGLEEITLPQSVTQIGYGAFKWCYDLGQITFTGTAPSIDQTAFEDVSADVYYPAEDDSWNGVAYNSYGGNLNWIPVYSYVAEGACGESLTWNLTQGGILTITGTGAMYDYTMGTAPWYAYAGQIQSVTIGYGVESIGDYAFARCTDLEEMSLPNSVTAIGRSAYEDCTALRQTIIPGSVTSVGAYAFAGCSSIGSIGLNVSHVSVGVFSGCTSLWNVHLSNVTHIGDEAFMNCKSLTSLYLPETVEHIGDFAFFGCSKLESMQFSKNLQYIGSYAYHNCVSLTYISFKGDAPEIGYKVLSNVSAEVRYLDDAQGWTEEFKQSLGGNQNWVEMVHTVVSVMQATDETGASGQSYKTMEEALANYDPKSQYLQLSEDLEVNITLTSDIYLEMFAYDLTGVINTNGYKIYGMDCQNNNYNCEDILGHFNCVDSNGNPVVPEKHFMTNELRNGSIRRYMAIEDEKGWTFHRFYLGITHTSLKPDAVGLGYKATFCGDPMVAAELDSYGYMLQLDGSKQIGRWKDGESFVSGQTLTLRIQNWDVENHGETGLNAQVALKLTDGTVIESALYCTNLRQALEDVNAAYTADPNAYSGSQMAAVKQLISRFQAIMQNWNVGDIFNTTFVLPPASFDSTKRYRKSYYGIFDGQEALYQVTVDLTSGGIWHEGYVRTPQYEGQTGMVYEGETWYGCAGLGDDLSYSITDTQVVLSVNEGEAFTYCSLLDNGQLRVDSDDTIYFQAGDLLIPCDA